MNAPNHYLGIAYEWALVPPEVVDFDVVLSICSCAGATGELLSVQMQEPELSVYHAKLPEKESRHELSDVSGCLGLLHPVADEHAARKAAAFERLVSDAILWRISQESFSSAERTTILLQGPMLPKLRGRLMYRGISENVTFCAVTHQPDWFRRVESAEQSYKVLHEAGTSGLGAVHPPRGLDRGTRSWVHRSSSGFPLHFEVVTNMLDCFCPTRNWVGEIEQQIEQLVTPQFLGIAHPPRVAIPLPLSRATDGAKDAKEREDVFVSFLLSLRGVDYDINKLDKVPKFAEMIRSMRGPRPKDGGGLDLNDCLGAGREEELYALFKETWRRTLQQPEKVLTSEHKGRFARKDLGALRDELLVGVLDLTIAGDHPALKRYIRKVAEDSLMRGSGRVSEIRNVFIDRKFVVPPHGREVFNRLTGDELIKRIALLIGVQP